MDAKAARMPATTVPEQHKFEQNHRSSKFTNCAIRDGMAVDRHLDWMAIEVLEHMDPLLGWKDTLKRTERLKTLLDLGREENLNDFDAFVVDLCIRRC